MESYLITGATGFVGANIVRRLVTEGKNVHVLVRDSKLNWRLSDISSKLNIHEIDLLNPDLFIILNKIKPSYIFHLAAYGSLPREDDINKLIDVNLRGTINLINAAKQNRFKLFINTGSSSEYGNKDVPMKETDSIMPINNYGVTKAAATLFAQKEAVRNNLPIITFRLFSPFGPYEEETRIVPYTILSAIKNKPISVGSRTNVRDFVHIDDVVNVYFQACKVKVLPGEIFNIGMGKQHQISDVVSQILLITNSESKIVWNNIKKQIRQVEPNMWEADVSKARKILEWHSRYDLQMGLRKTIEWFNNNYDLYVR